MNKKNIEILSDDYNNADQSDSIDILYSSTAGQPIYASVEEFNANEASGIGLESELEIRTDEDETIFGENIKEAIEGLKNIYKKK